MKKTSKTIVFFGSGPVAAASLELLAKHCSIEAVVTKPQPPHHKEPFPVLTVAEKLGINQVYTPTSKQELSELFADNPVQSHLGIVIDYGYIINQDVIDYFPLGIVNSHFSLLPEWRGADPIRFAILNGQKVTGVSLMLITAGMDEGPVFAQAEQEIQEDNTEITLTQELIELSDAMLRDFLPEYISGAIEPRPQAEIASMMDRSIHPSYSRKLTKDDGIIDWKKPAIQIEREIRAFIEWPKSRTTLGGKDVIITEAYSDKSTPASGQPGDIITSKESKTLSVLTSAGSLYITKLKPAGKKEMPISAFLAGYKIN